MRCKEYQKKSLADMLTPVGAYLKLRNHYSELLLLESTDYHTASNSKSFICFQPLRSFSLQENRLAMKTGSETAVQTVKPEHALRHLEEYKSEIHFTEHTEKDASPGFNRGLFGYSAFESTQYFDSHVYDSSKRKQDIPDMYYAFYRFILVFNHHHNTLEILENCPEHEPSLLPEVERILNRQDTEVFPFKAQGSVMSNLTDNGFKDLVIKGKEHCQRGDVFQVVFSRAFSQQYTGDDFCVYRALRSVNPSPYLFYFDYGSFKIFGSSPEAQLLVSNGEAEIHPIAGTYRRTGDDAHDQKEAERLKLDPKENSEHVMLVDLARNDLSRNGHSVKVSTYKDIQYFSHVIHLVSKVKGRLKNSASTLRVYADTFPAGTLSGAPKHKAISLIQQYENKHRSFYGGAIGYISLDGDTLNKAIIIRSFLSQKNTLHFQAGAGIVISSDPEKECEEVNNKLAALVSAINLAENL